MNAVDITTKDPWYTGLMDLPTAGYADGVMDADIKQLATNLKKSSNLYNQVQDWKTYISLVGDPAWAGYSKFTPAQQKDYANKAKTVYTDAFNKWMEQAKLPTSVQTLLSDDPTAKLPSYLSGYLALDPKDPASVEAYKAQIKKDFGGLKKSNGDPVISDVLIDQVASGKQDFSTLNDIVSQAVTSAVGKELGSAASQISDITKTDAYQNLLSNPSALTSSYNSKVAGLTQDATTGAWAPKTAKTDTSPKPGITSLGPYSGSISDVDTPAKMKQVVDTYDPNKGVYRAPSLDASGNLVSNATSPYSNILNGMLSGYKNPYAAGYTNQLKMPETPNLTNIKKSFENNPTSADLLKLANSAGQPYDSNAKTSLSPALTKMYQPSVINSAGQPAKPGAPDTTNTTLPVVPKPGDPIITDTGKVVNPSVVNPSVVNPPVVKPPVKTAAELAAENTSLAAWNANVKRIGALQNTFTSKQQMESWYAAHPEDDPSNLKRYGASATDLTMGEEAKAREAAYNAQQAVEKAAADKIAADKIAADKIAADKIAADKALADKAAADKAAADKAAADKAAADKIAAEVAVKNATNQVTGYAGPSAYNGYVSPITLQQIAAQQNNTATDPKSYTVSGGLELPKGVGVNTGIVTPDVTKFATTDNLNTTSGVGVNTLLGGNTQPAVNYTYAPSSQQQLEDQAVNAGYQGDYSDTAAMQGYLNSNAGGVASLVSPQVTVQQQSAAGTNTVLAANPSQKPAVVQQTPQNPWDNMGISQQDYYENYW